MSRTTQVIIAAIGVFAGSLLSDAWFGDGIQADDAYQAAMVAIIAGILQLWLTRKRP